MTYFQPIAKPHAGSMNLVLNVAKEPATGYRVACEGKDVRWDLLPHEEIDLTSSPIACTVQYKTVSLLEKHQPTALNLRTH